MLLEINSLCYDENFCSVHMVTCQYYAQSISSVILSTQILRWQSDAASICACSAVPDCSCLGLLKILGPVSGRPSDAGCPELCLNAVVISDGIPNVLNLDTKSSVIQNLSAVE